MVKEALQSCFANFKKHYTPKVRFSLRIFLVCGFICFNIYNIVDNLNHINNVIAFAITIFVMIMCMLVVLMVGYPVDDINKNEKRPSGYSNSAASTEGKRINSSDERGGDYLDQRNDAKPATGTYSSSASLLTINEGSNSSSSNSPSTLTDDHDGEAPDPNVFSGFGHHFIRENSSVVVAMAAVGLVATICTSIYYLQLAIRRHEPFSFSTFRQSTYMCFILYLLCGKWFVIIILLMRRILKVHREQMQKAQSLKVIPVKEYM
eukprot:GILI01021703.1.p1 GENE.GILI01021703.1~~GILI01021703.1.p1  ORF type:complete len:275 (-),score=23.40 GILI01021703.1:250-1038(-)